MGFGRLAIRQASASIPRLHAVTLRRTTGSWLFPPASDSADQGSSVSRAAMTSGDHESKPAAGNGLTYRAAGVDIEAADALVETIKPLARATNRRGVMGGLGGFGALFDLKSAG